jgi:type II secretory pathway pseudopilin PulG
MVIIIIAIMSSIVVPAYAHYWDRTRFNNEIGDVRDLLTYAREQAITNDTTVTVSYQGSALIATVSPPPAQSDLPVVDTNGSNPDVQLAQTQAGVPPEPRILPIGGDLMVAGFNVGSQTTMPGTVNISSVSSMGGAGSTGGAAGGSALHFEGDGTCEGAQIMLIGINGFEANIVISPSTGELKVDDGTGPEAGQPFGTPPIGALPGGPR